MSFRNGNVISDDSTKCSTWNEIPVMHVGKHVTWMNDAERATVLASNIYSGHVSTFRARDWTPLLFLYSSHQFYHLIRCKHNEARAFMRHLSFCLRVDVFRQFWITNTIRESSKQLAVDAVTFIRQRFIVFDMGFLQICFTNHSFNM